MNDDLVKDINGLNTGLSKLDKLLEKLTVSASKFTTALGGVRNVGSGGGQGQLNLGNSGGNVMPSSLGNVPQFLAMNRGMNVGSSLVQGAMSAITGVVGGAFQAMPDVQATTARSYGLYQAALMSGTRGWNGIGSSTLRLMKGGITTSGGEGAVAAQLSGMGFQYGGKGLFGGFNTMAQSVAGAAIGFNMENSVAAQALGGLTSGATSSAIMQNFGVFTSNPMTGERATPTQTFAMLNDRMTQGGRMTQAEVIRGLNGGFLEQNVRESGLDEAQQGLLKQYMIDAAGGDYWDLNDKKAMAKRAAAAGGNPLQPLMDVSTAESGSMQAASASYVSGMEKAAKAVELFEGAMTNFLNSPAGKVMAQLNSGVNLAGQSSAVQGAMVAAGGLVNSATTIGQSIMDASKLGGTVGGGNTSTVVGSAAKRVGSAALKGLGVAGGVIGVGVNAANSYQSAQAGADGWSVAGSALSGAAAGALGGMAFGVPGAVIGALIGGGASLIGSYMGSQNQGGSGGATDLVGTGGMSDTKGGLKLVHPVKGPITTKYGQTTDAHGKELWGGNQHKAIDYGVPVGTPVQAAASGTVKATGSGAGERSYGNYIELDHGNGYTTLYAHLSSIQVTTGQSVVQGQVIGLSGATGYATGPHLHFEVRKNGMKINPASLGLGDAVAIVAGNANTAASSSATSSGSVGGGVDLTPVSNTYTGTQAAAVPASYKGASIGGGVSARVSGGSSLASNTGYGSMQNGTGRGSGVGGGQGGPGLDLGGSKASVIINLTIAKASAEEARRFADLVKEQLESEKLMTNMGRM
jgi:murein DD-endopeptidase MepM/ murein hydrolase activator NlpD